MKIFTALCAIILMAGFHTNAYAQTGVTVPEMNNVDQVFSKFMNDWNLPGGSIAIERFGRLVYARGFGLADQESVTPVEPHHLFRIASVSKPITSIAIMKLIDDGQLNVDDSVFGAGGILAGPDYDTILDARVTDITVRQLLHHTSGWGEITGQGDPMFRNSFIAQQLGETSPVGPVSIIRFMLTNQTLDTDPGSVYQYSNFGYVILGRVIEQVSGQSYEGYVQSALLAPLGITGMKLGKNRLEDRDPDEVRYYDFPGASLVPTVYGGSGTVPWPYGGFNIEAMDSHGGWIASPTDLVRLLVAADGFTSNPDILSSSSIQLMTTASTANTNYALGWAVNRFRNWWGTGSLPGTSSIIVRTNGDLGWAVMFNTRPPNWREFIAPMDNMVWEAIGGVSSWPTHDLFEQATSIDNEKPAVLTSLKLDPVFPNPFESSTQISYELAKDVYVDLSVFDLLGQKLMSLVHTRQPAGRYHLTWDGRSDSRLPISNGVFLLRLKTGSTATYRTIIRVH